MFQILKHSVRPSFASALLLAGVLGLSASPAVLAQSATAASAPVASAAKVVQTRPGAMVSRIASANRPAGATQDQTLLAILHANPDAFMADNINLLKKGAALTMPTAEQALSVPAEEARALIRQQHADYEKHGYGLVQLAAAGTASAPVATASAVEAPVLVPAPVASTPAAAASVMAPASAAPVVAALPAASSASEAALVASAASAPAATIASAPASVVAAPASEAAPASTGNGLPWWAWTLTGVLALLLIGFLQLWRAAQRREAERLAAEAAAAAGPRASAEALSRAMDLSQPDHVPALEQELQARPADVAPAAATTTTTHDDPLPEDSADLSGLTLDLPEEDADSNSADDALPPATDKPLVFDFSNLSLDIEGPADAEPGETALLTKLSLAREFFAISDLDGARVLAQEVLDKTDSSSLKADAEALLARIAASDEA